MYSRVGIDEITLDREPSSAMAQHGISFQLKLLVIVDPGRLPKPSISGAQLQAAASHQASCNLG
jgi:hypothetical protein